MIDNWVEKLNGREYRKELTPEEEKQLKAEGLVVVFGGSDDLMELRGAIDDEIGCYEGGLVFFNETGLLQNECPEEECPYFEKAKKEAITIEAIWDSAGYSWIYETNIPHKRFDILETNDPYCRGIIFSLSDLQETVKKNNEGGAP